MNKLVSICKVALMSLVGFVVVSCSADFADEMDGMNAFTAFGNISGAEATITEDSGDVLHIIELGEQLTQSEVDALSGRIFFNYTVIDGLGNDHYNIRLNCIYPLYIEDIKVLSQMSEEEKKALGADPVSPVQATLTGGHINVQICYVQGINTPDDFMHDVDLIFDDKESSSNTMSVYLRHKGDGTNAVTDKCEAIYEWVSFRLTQPVLDFYNREENETGAIYQLYVMFKWLWWSEAGDVLEYVGSMDPTPYGTVFNEADEQTTFRVPMLM